MAFRFSTQKNENSANDKQVIYHVKLGDRHETPHGLTIDDQVHSAGVPSGRLRSIQICVASNFAKFPANFRRIPFPHVKSTHGRIPSDMSGNDFEFSSNSFAQMRADARGKHASPSTSSGKRSAAAREGEHESSRSEFARLSSSSDSDDSEDLSAISNRLKGKRPRKTAKSNGFGAAKRVGKVDRVLASEGRFSSNDPCVAPSPHPATLMSNSCYFLFVNQSSLGRCRSRQGVLFFKVQ